MHMLCPCRPARCHPEEAFTIATVRRTRRVSWGFVGAAYLGAIAALLVQQVLEPFAAGSHMGLLTNGGDLDIYRHGALQVRHGNPLYAAEIPPGGWFTYPPFAAIAFLPLSLASFPIAKAVWMVISFAALTATIWRCATTLGYRPDRRLALLSLALAIAAVDVEAVRGTLWQGQVNLVLMALVVWDLTRPNGSRLRGWSVGVAAGVKLTAIVFVPYLLVTRQWRAAGTAIATAVLTVVLSAVTLPADTTAYWTHAVFQTDRIGPLTHPGNFSIGGILATLTAPGPMPVGWWLLGVGLAAVLGLSAAYLADRTGHRVLAIAIVGLLSCTVPPLAWGHHWVWSIPLLAVVLDAAVRTSGRARWSWAAITATVYLVVFMWFNAWLYAEARQLSGSYPTYVAALDAAIGQMTRHDRLLAVAIHPALFVVVAAITVIIVTRRAATDSTQRFEFGGRDHRGRSAPTSTVRLNNGSSRPRLD